MKQLAFSIDSGNGTTTTIQGPPQIPVGGLSDKGQPLITSAITILLIATVILALAFLIFGGIRMIISGGDKQKTENARKTITYSILGLVIAFLSFFIISLIGNAFGITNILGAPSANKLPPGSICANGNRADVNGNCGY